MNSKAPILLPYPKSLEFSDGVFKIGSGVDIITETKDRDCVFPQMEMLSQSIFESTSAVCRLKTVSNTDDAAGVVFKYKSSCRKQGYEISVTASKIEISFSDAPGSFYAVCTLKQLISNYHNTIPCMKITDFPDFPVRGAMIDVSRNKIPSMKTLYRYVDFLSSIKINQLQLYMEGFSFAYPSCPEYWKDTTPITGEEIALLDKYCKERFIELVPNINCFGHMQDWLEKPEIRHLAESPYGYDCSWGNDLPPATLNPDDAGSIELAEKIISDIAHYFSSGQFNVGLDETMELGHEKSRESCEKLGRGRVYYNYLMEIYKLISKTDKKMMFWGDIIKDYPEVVKDLPKNVTLLEWGYEANHPFEEHCRIFKEARIPYYVCPGTSSWCSITGRSENMRLNLLNAAENGLKYGATGYLITDWGDRGHWQYLPVSYAGFSFGAALAWNYDGNRRLDVSDFLNMFIFKDSNNLMGRFVLDCGNYYLNEKEHIGNATIISEILLGHDDLNIKITEEELLKTSEYIKNLESTLYRTDMHCDDSSIVFKEYETALMLVKHGIKLGLYDIRKERNEDFPEREDMIFELLDEISRIKLRHMELWTARNRLCGLQKSLKQMYALEEYYLSELKKFRKKARAAGKQ